MNFLKIKDVQSILGCGKARAYDIVKLKGFPKIIIGSRYYIPEDKFYEWLNMSVYAKIKLHN